MMTREQLTINLPATACRSKEAVGRWQADTASRTNNLGFFALRKSPVNYTQSRGAVLLIAILVASVALAVGLGVYNRTYKELLFASYWKQTQTAFSAADVGLECALYFELHPSAVPVSCFDSNIVGWTPGTVGSFQLATPSSGCVSVVISWDGTSTSTIARGYNTPYNTSSSDCANTNPRRVERGLSFKF